MTALPPWMMQVAQQALAAPQPQSPSGAPPVGLPTMPIPPANPSTAAPVMGLPPGLVRRWPAPQPAPAAPPPAAAQPPGAPPPAGAQPAAPAMPTTLPELSLHAVQAGVGVAAKGREEVRKADVEAAADDSVVGKAAVDAGLAQKKADEEKAAIQHDALDQGHLQLQAEYQKMVKAQQAAAVKADAQITAMQQQIDMAAQTRVNSWFDQASTGGKMLGVLGLVLAGGSNGFQAIMGLISNDLEAQKLNQENAQRAVENRRSLLDEMRRVTGDEVSALNASTEVALKAVDKQAEALTKRLEMAGNPQAKANLAKLQQKIAETVQSMGQRRTSDHLKNMLEADKTYTDAQGKVSQTIQGILTLQKSSGATAKQLAAQNEYVSNLDRTDEALGRIQKANGSPTRADLSFAEEGISKMRNPSSNRPVVPNVREEYKKELGLRGDAKFGMGTAAHFMTLDRNALIRLREELAQRRAQAMSGQMPIATAGSGGSGSDGETP